MKLQQNSSEPGLLVNPDWQPRTPGTFAVIIGASRYPYLADGEDPAPQTYSLGQLAVSALTAYEWFRWLTSAYTYTEAPIAKCWVLLASTAAERSFEPDLADHTTEPTFDNCRKALGYWWKTMRDLPSDLAAKSRALFFFSGHGIEIYQDKQILLPSDYLCPPSRSWNDAISTENLKRALASLDVPNQFFFLDACRNGNAELRRKVINGATILNEDQSDAVNPALVAPLLFATSSGQQAFQQPDPGRGLSLFGSALIDGLNGKPDLALIRHESDYAVNLYALQAFVKHRVAELLAATGENVIQPIKMSGVVDDATITYLKPYTVRASRFGKIVGFGRDVAGTGFGFIVSGQAPTVESMAEKALPVTLSPSDSLNSAYRAGDFNARHDIFGSENVSALWQPDRVRVFGLDARDWLPPAPFKINHVARTENTSSYRLELEFTIRDSVGYWLELGTSGARWACILLADSTDSVRYRLEFDVAFDSGNGREITRLEAALALSNPGSLGQAALLWHKYRTADLGAAIRVYQEDAPLLRELVGRKLESPLSALVAAVVLVRANRSDLLDNWLHNLATWLPYLPDGAVLWAEHLARNSKAAEVLNQEAASSLANIANRPLPFTSEGFSYASHLVQFFTGRAFTVGPDTAASLAQLKARLDHALPYLQPGGLFTTYTGFQSGQVIPLLGLT
jgi:hypothetical protein